MQPLIELREVYAGYEVDKSVIKNINFKVFPNDFIGVIGPNGGGKSTLLKVILGLLLPLKGEVVNYVAQDKVNNLFGYLPQISNVDKTFPIKVIDVVLSGLIGKRKFLKGLSKAEKAKAINLLKLVGLENKAKESIGSLSGGQMQRVYLCRAIITDPKLLILDEPNNFVDKHFEAELYNILSELNKRMAILLVSHDIGIISSYIKTIACVNEELHYHQSNKISAEMLQTYNCPIELIAHGSVPHRVLGNHKYTP